MTPAMLWDAAKQVGGGSWIPLKATPHGHLPAKSVAIWMPKVKDGLQASGFKRKKPNQTAYPHPAYSQAWQLALNKESEQSGAALSQNSTTSLTSSFKGSITVQSFQILPRICPQKAKHSHFWGQEEAKGNTARIWAATFNRKLITAICISGESLCQKWGLWDILLQTPFFFHRYILGFFPGIFYIFKIEVV